MTTRQLTDALTTIGATHDEQGRWPAPDDVDCPGPVPGARHHAAGRDLTRRAMIDALVTAGYTPTSAEARKISNHPLIRHIGPDRYRIVRNDSPEPAP